MGVWSRKACASAIRVLRPTSGVADAERMTEPDPWITEAQPPPSRLRVCRGKVFRRWLACGYVETFWQAERVFARWEREHPEQVFALYSGERIVLPNPPGTFPLLYRLPGPDGRLPPPEEPEPWPGVAPHER